MFTKSFKIIMSLLILVSLTGCAAISKRRSAPEAKILKEQILVLEAKIAKLNDALKREKQEKDKLINIFQKQDKKLESITKSLDMKTQNSSEQKEGKSYYSYILIAQTALKNAGFKPGLIDGKMGERTHAALKAFQEANGLPANGQLDKETWVLLRKHL